MYERKIQDCTLRAPADGVIVKIPCRNSMYVTEGETAVVMVDGQETMVWAFVDEAFIRKVKVGQSALVRSEVYTHLQYGSFDAEVVKISAVPIKDASGAVKYPVRLHLDTDNFDIKYGSKVTVTIIIGNTPAIYTLLNISAEDEII